MNDFLWGSLGKEWVESHRGQTLTDLDLRLRKPQYVEVDADFGERLKEAGQIESFRALALKRGVPEHKVKDGFESNLMLFTGSTEARDRYGDRILVDGWLTDEYNLNPVFLGFHDYDSPAIGQSLDVYRDVVTPKGKTYREGSVEFRKAGNEGKRRLRFLMLWAVDENPQARILHGLYKGRDMRATSVGFIPGEVHVPGSDEERAQLDLGSMGVLHKKQTLLELSAVAVPALPEAIQEESFEAYRKGLDEQEQSGLAKFAEQIKSIDADLAYAVRSYLPGKRKTVDVLPAMGRGVVPANVSTKLADKGTAWAKPNLSDFGIDSWDKASASDKRKVAGHFAWADASPASSFGQLKLPHHRASDGAVVFRGVAAAAGRLGQSRIPSADLAKAKSHLRSHYRAFGEVPPPALEAMHLSADAMRERLGKIDGGEPITEAELEGLKSIFDVSAYEITTLREAVRKAGKDPEFELDELDAQFNAILVDGTTLEDDGPGDDATHPGDKLGDLLDAITADLDTIKGKEGEGDDNDPAPAGAENRVVPDDVTQELSDPETPWEPLTEETVDFEALDEEQRTVLAGFFAYAADIPPASFGELLLSHHQLPDGLVNLTGVREAMRMLLERDGEGGDVPDDDRRAVYDHLAAHLEAFGSEIPEYTEGYGKNPKDPKKPKKDVDDTDPALDLPNVELNSIVARAMRDAAAGVVDRVKRTVLEQTGIALDFDIDERGQIRKWRVVRGHSPEKAAPDFKFSRAEFEKAVGDDIKLRRDCCLIYDAADEKNPKSYLFPHHQAKDGIPVVWSEVVKSMKKLLGKSLDGSIPDEIRRRAHVHLRGHYEQFERDAPAFRSIEQLAALGEYLRETANALADANEKTRAGVELSLDLVYAGFQMASDKAFEIQSLVFSSDNWKKEDVEAYAKDNGFVGDVDIEETRESLVLTVRERSDFVSISERRDDTGEAPVTILGGRLKSGVDLISDEIASIHASLDSGLKEIKQAVENLRGGKKSFLPKNGDDPYAVIYKQTEETLRTVESNLAAIKKR